MTSPSDRTPALSLENIVKTFPGVRALDGVSFDVLPGETHALLGENGAGKSTLMKVLAGIYQPDEGRILIEGRPVIMRSPLEAKRRGVVLIHQELSLADNLSVAENIYLGELPHRSFGRVDWNVLNERVRAILKSAEVSLRSDDVLSWFSSAILVLAWRNVGSEERGSWSGASPHRPPRIHRTRVRRLLVLRIVVARRSWLQESGRSPTDLTALCCGRWPGYCWSSRAQWSCSALGG